MKGYRIVTERATEGPWRVNEVGDRFADAMLDDGRRVFVAVRRDKKVRIPFKPRGLNRGWTYVGTVKVDGGRFYNCGKVAGNIGVRGLLKIVGLLKPAGENKEGNRADLLEREQ